MNNKLFVGGLDYSVTDSRLDEYFSTIGKVASAKVIVDRYSGQGKGFGFVEMSTAEEAKMAMDKLNGTELAGRTITVKEAKPQENKSWNDNGRNNKW